jgi:hypothetical protein
MATTLGDPEEVERLARRHEAAADEIVRVAEETQRRLLSREFCTSRSTALANAAAARTQEAYVQAGELRDIARSLRAHATWIRDTLAEMQQLERRIRAWALANPLPATGVSLSPDAGIVGTYPPPGSLGWRDVADLLRTRGVVF